MTDSHAESLVLRDSIGTEAVASTVPRGRIPQAARRHPVLLVRRERIPMRGQRSVQNVRKERTLLKGRLLVRLALRERMPHKTALRSAIHAVI